MNDSPEDEIAAYALARIIVPVSTINSSMTGLPGTKPRGYYFLVNEEEWNTRYTQDEESIPGCGRQ